MDSARLEVVYWTYGIVDPNSKLFVYVGQTKDFERRKREHLTAHRLKNPPRRSIKSWLKRLHQGGLEPLFVVLEVVETETESIHSENKWVEKLAAIGQPLYNRWDEHLELIEAAGQEHIRPLEPLIFGKDGGAKKIGSCQPNASKTGFRISIKKGTKLEGPVTIDLVPKRKNT